ncbi:MAG TPA: hypothetical protein PLE73_12395 [Spirochaetota bacterium]|nr:hypothetical protein [Spirochaetota bacterium]HOS38500.1 hypothetical protein [Spirochaetota bacterium]HPI23993.1 hypothetical protein [Spirochaetota bacterium]HPU89846.1 hypothetical protein [Spirochaetota bacterium]
MKAIRGLIAGCAALALSCGGFIRAEDGKRIARLEQYVFVARKDVSNDQRRLRAGQPIRLFIRAEDKWIKVYGYPHDQNILEADRVLLLYLFPDDFKGSKYDHDFFIWRLADEVVLLADQPVDKKKDAKQDAKKGAPQAAKKDVRSDAIEREPLDPRKKNQ